MTLSSATYHLFLRLLTLPPDYETPVREGHDDFHSYIPHPELMHSHVQNPPRGLPATYGWVHL